MYTKQQQYQQSLAEGTVLCPSASTTTPFDAESWEKRANSPLGVDAELLAAQGLLASAKNN
jgi:hypothetical protein